MKKKWKFKVGDIIRNSPDAGIGNDWLLVTDYSTDDNLQERYETIVLYTDMYGPSAEPSILRGSADESYIFMA